ncbi:rhodanese-like domain-containing protein [Halobacteriales archaeon QS_8_69_26]|nr:MAG: rhodanese-like domain-containing protein [Halobacteriales archaeon QS_8_69_26]
MSVDRRAFLATAAVSVAGCLSGGDSTPDGYPPAFEETPAPRPVDPSTFPTADVRGVAVPLAPIEVTYYWYRRREARFADARGREQYERARIRGAASSPAPDGGDDDPVASWPREDRIVCYCGCPHHLSALRAATLIADGYERVYVIDEGFWEWHDRRYPVAGTEVAVRPEVRTIRGRTDSRHAGETAWAFHDPTGQREADPIDDGGRYRLDLSFADVSPSSVVRVGTPEYTVRRPLSSLTEGVVTGP